MMAVPVGMLACLGVLALASALLAARPVGRLLAVASGLLGVVHLQGAVHTRRLWEGAARRTAYVSAHATGITLDRTVDMALGAALMAVSLACWALVPAQPAWSQRTLAVCTALMASAAVLGSVVTGLPLR